MSKKEQQTTPESQETQSQSDPTDPKAGRRAYMNLRPDGDFTEEDVDAFLEALLGDGDEEVKVKPAEDSKKKSTK